MLGRRVRLTTSLPPVSRLPRKSRILDVSLPCGPPRPLRGIALLLHKNDDISHQTEQLLQCNEEEPIQLRINKNKKFDYS
jgi:hypothetical protein